jgi:PAS domain S-box-containing protein
LKEKQIDLDSLLSEVDELKQQLFEANAVIEAIREGGVDALVVNTNGRPDVYSLKSADYTYRILIEKFGEGALSISESGVILYCNEYFSKLIDLPADKITGTFFDAYVETVGEYKELMEKSSSGLSKGEIILNSRGKKIPVYVSFTNLQPTLPAIGIIITDLTEKRKHEEELLLHQKTMELKIEELYQTNTNLEQFIHVISHDIKEPIRKIITYVNHLMLHNAQFLEEARFNPLKKINNSTLRLNSLVDDLVKYSALTNPGGFSEVDLTIILNEVKDDLELIIQENEAVISCGPLPKIYGSVVQMRQLFSNLLMNSLKYRKAATKPEINIVSEIIQCKKSGLSDMSYYKISVTDNGIGMEQEYLEKIFTIFQRLHIPSQYSGNGIGLAICKKIMKNHMGKIEAESIIGTGSTFNIYFPIK